MSASGGQEGGGGNDEKTRNAEAWSTVQNRRKSGGDRVERGRGPGVSERGRGFQGRGGGGGKGNPANDPRPRGSAPGSKGGLPTPGRVGARGGARPGSERGTFLNPGASPSPSMASLRRKWMSEGRCLKCGSESHKKKDCDTGSTSASAPPSSRDSSASRATPPVASASKERATPTVGQKRRTTSSTGITPSPKRGPGVAAAAASYAAAAAGTVSVSASKRAAKYSYAEAAAGSPELVAVNDQLKHIPRSKYLEIQKVLSADYLKSCREGISPLKVEDTGHDHTSAWWKLRDHETMLRVRAIISKVDGIECMTRDELLEKRRPLCIMSGLVRGQVTASLTKEELKLILKTEIQEKEIEGRMELASAKVTENGNLIIRILLDDVAEANFAVWANTLHFGVDGKVRFHKVTKKDSSQPDSAAASNADALAGAAALNADAMETEPTNANVTMNLAVSQLSVPERVERLKLIEAEKADLLANLQGEDLENSIRGMMSVQPAQKMVLREAGELQRQLQQQLQQSPERQADGPPHQSTPVLKRSDSVVTVGSMVHGLNQIELAKEIAEGSQALIEDMDAEATAAETAAAAEAEANELLESDSEEKAEKPQ